METFEAAKKAADAAAEEADGSSPEAERCLDALRRLREFRVNTDVLVSTQVCRPLPPARPQPGNQAIRRLSSRWFR